MPARSQGSAARPDSTTTTFRESGWALRRHAWLISGITITVVILTAIATALATPTYESEVTLHVRTESKSDGLLGRLGDVVNLGLPGLDQDETGTEMGVLRSRSIAGAVADSLALNLMLAEPAVPRRQVLSVIQPSRDAPPGEYTLTSTGRGAYAMEANDLQVPVTLPSEVRVGQPFRIGELVLVVRESGDNAPERIRFTIAPFRRALEEMRENLLVERQEGGSKLIEVSYRSTDPVLAAAVANGIAESFMQYNKALGSVESRRTVQVLREQVALYERQLREAEEQLRSFREQQRVIAPEEQATQQVRRVSELQAGRQGLQIERRTLAQLLERVSTTTPRAGEESPYRQITTFPAFIGNRAVQDILQTLIELENERSQKLILRTTADPDVRQLSQRIKELETQLYRLASSYLENLDNQIRASQAAVDQFDADLRAIPVREVEFARLLREQKLLNEVYLQLQGRLKEAEVTEAVETGNTLIVDAAEVPDKPISPRPVVNLALGTVLGLMLGFAAALGRVITDTRVRTLRDVEEVVPGIPVVGTVPQFGNGNGKWAGAQRYLPWRGNVLARTRPVPALTSTTSSATAAEAYRGLRATLSRAGQESVPECLVVTSSLPGEGKTTTAANLALALAQQGRSVVLVDADLRRGMIHEVFGLSAEPGLAQVLRGSATLGAVLQEHRVNGNAPLTLLPSGGVAPGCAELLGSDAMRDLLQQLRTRFDLVVVDTPPLNVVADAALIAAMADATLLVTRAGHTDRRALETALGRVEQLNIPLAGVVLNGTATEHEPYAGYFNDTAR